MGIVMSDSGPGLAETKCDMLVSMMSSGRFAPSLDICVPNETRDTADADMDVNTDGDVVSSKCCDVWDPVNEWPVEVSEALGLEYGNGGVGLHGSVGGIIRMRTLSMTLNVVR